MSAADLDAFRPDRWKQAGRGAEAVCPLVLAAALLAARRAVDAAGVGKRRRGDGPAPTFADFAAAELRNLAVRGDADALLRPPRAVRPETVTALLDAGLLPRGRVAVGGDGGAVAIDGRICDAGELGAKLRAVLIVPPAATAAAEGAT